MLPMIARNKPIDADGTKNVFVSAFCFATSVLTPCPPFGPELKISAQEQIEFMLGEDSDTLLITSEEEVKSAVRKGLSEIRSSFETTLSTLLIGMGQGPVIKESEAIILQRLNDLEWICNILPKMELMKDFVLMWVDISGYVLGVVEDEKLESQMWGLKLKLIELTGKVLDAVGYGTVILPAPSRVKLLKLWLPYIRKVKALLDLKSEAITGFAYKMDEDLCQSIEGTIVSFVLALPSNDQADILADWMKNEDCVSFPDLTEAFEIWCFRAKTAKRRLVEGLERTRNDSVTP
ncbi:BTB/POZ domain-containing protein At3g05675 [Punica granatum]|uniref:BTB/POZ domain-containing protein At3g05675 n=1 Tax=Punica granatum TaxID=22663 RepID=A0A218WH67_PUNGR|nr:BTB/POZ domain-containing protein At3g05675 [Punica granatum]XP_031377411.1 BTB/POZ domain-containing protein At3g05675 [Punica granatum]OWM72194.1 hypothetical protein CDL15_Pgr018078 [Punica granatum]